MSNLLRSILRAERPVKAALGGMVLAGGVGWLMVCSLIGYVGVLRGETIIAQRDAATSAASIGHYKRVAAKAYTEMLVAKGGTADSKLLIPVGTRIECNINYKVVAGKTVGNCEGPLLLPPSTYAE